MIQSLVGDVTEEQMINVDLYPTQKFGVFVPSVGFCYYSTTPNHTHPAYAVFITLTDECIVNVEGKTVIGKPGKMHVISPNVVHHEVAGEKFTRFFAVMIEKAYFEAEMKHYCDTVPVYTTDMFTIPKGLIGELREFIIEYKTAVSSTPALLEACAIRITHRILRSMFAVSCARETFEGRVEVEKAIDYMHSNFQQKITRDQVAACTSVSPSHFGRMFKKETGYSVMDYLLNVRINKAKHILATREDSLTSTAYEVGFSSSSHFSTAFKQVTGESPKEYRKQNCMV